MNDASIRRKAFSVTLPRPVGYSVQNCHGQVRVIKLTVKFVCASRKMLQEEEEKNEADHDDGVPGGECFTVEVRPVRQVPKVHAWKLRPPVKIYA